MTIQGNWVHTPQKQDPDGIPLLFLANPGGPPPGRMRGHASWTAPRAASCMTDLLAEFEAAHRLAVRCGLTGNQAVLSACRAVAKTSGLDPIKLLGISGLEGGAIHFSAGELGRHLKLTARQVNRMLADLGMQERIATSWVPTTQGSCHAVVLDVGKQHSNGSPVTQLRWKLSILSQLDPDDLLIVGN